MKLTTGDKVYLMPVGDNYRRGDKLPQEATVQKAGRKYIHVTREGSRHAIMFDRERHREATEYSPGWELYLSRQALMDELERRELEFTLRDAFGSLGRYDFTLDQLRRIKAIVDEGDT